MILSELPDYARDAFYIAVGLGALATRNIVARHQSLTQDIEARINPIRDQFKAHIPTLTIPELTLPSIDLDAQFPAGTRDFVSHARGVVEQAREQLSTLVTRPA